VAGVGGIWFALPLRRESHFFEGEMAILAKESFCEMERRRLCGPLDLMMGEADDVVEVS
jgi:hypothetical protein